METKFDELLASIVASYEYKKYKECEKKVSHNKELNDLVREIKELQKKATKLEYYHDDEYIDIDKKVKEKNNELENNPLYKEYANRLDDLNEIIAQSSYIINEYLKGII